MTATVASEPFLFHPTGSPPDSVDQTRLEITQLVREVAKASRRDDSREQYVRFLSDRILRAMAAHGVVIWSVPDDDLDSEAITDDQELYRYAVEYRIGTITDLQFDATAAAVHDRLLLDVAGHQTPVVVPPTPGAADVDVPANPTTFPAAVIPVFIDPASALPTFLIEVFLEPGGSPASQRGALRFLAQMGDLAGEFLRADRLRTLNRQLRDNDACTRLIDSWNRLGSTRQIEAAWVDGLADLLDCPRVALCRVDRGRPRIVAVSHVDRIDHLSDAAETIRRAASTPLEPSGSIAIASLQTERRSGSDRRTSETTTETTTPDRPTVIPNLVAASSADSRWRVILFADIDSGRDGRPSPPGTRALIRLLQGGNQAWTAAHRVEAIPGGRWWSRLTAPIDDASHGSRAEREPIVSSLRRRAGLLAAMGLATTLLLCLPIPSLVPATGLIRPLELDTYHAASDASVQTLQVRHGQEVRRGDVLATLTSRDLAERKTTLLGRRAVLIQRREQLKQSMMASNRSTMDSASWSSDQEIDEEIDAIDRQLEIINESESDLVLRARRDGRVDAWRLQERLAGRPLRRGDVVMSVIADDTTWVVDATIPQRRVARIDRAIAAERLTAEVSTRWSPGEVRSATAHRFGPVVSDPVDGTPSVIFRLTLSDPPRLGDQPLAETPASVAIRCGRISIGRFLFEDVAGWLQTRVGVYL